MTELLAVLSRGALVVALAYLIGGPLFLAVAGPAAAPGLARWRRCLIFSFPVAAVVLLLAGLAALGAQAAAVLSPDDPFAAFSLDVLVGLARDTHYGRVWAARSAIAIVLLVAALVLAIRRSNGRWSAAALSVLATAAAAVGTLNGHAAGSERALALVPAHAIHLVAAGAWLGGLPAWFGLVRAMAVVTDPAAAAFATVALRRFSRLATVCVAAITGAGVALAWEFVADGGDLLGTSYGRLIVAKLFLLAGALAMADRLRRRLLPRLGSGAGREDFARAARAVSVEAGCGFGILVLGAWLAQTTPATHDQPFWWLPFRLSWDATWPAWPTPLYVGGAVALLVAAGVLIWSGARLRPSVRHTSAGLLAVGGAILLAWSLSVPAFPDTYRRSGVAYLTVSIAHGQSIFEERCQRCHGSGGHGDGPLARSMRRPPANLTEPHTALHTAGDMYWWFSEGIPAGGMPGFAGVLSEEDRWDIVNFLRAFSQGFQSRILRPTVIPDRPWLGAPNFYIEPTLAAAGELKSFRERSNVLLVFFTAGDPASLARLRQLARERDGLAADATEILAIPVDGRAPAEPLPLAVRLHGAAEVWQAYKLFARTVGDRGDDARIGVDRRHVEFLVDRYGYVRGRWTPGEDPPGWQDIGLLRQQLAQLNRERRILPPPDDHVH